MAELWGIIAQETVFRLNLSDHLCYNYLIMAIFFALLALTGWATGDIFITIVSRKYGNKLTFLYWMVISLILSLLYLPFAGEITDWSYLGIAVGISFISFIANFSYFKALEIGIASLVGTIAGSFAIVTVPLSIILFKESLSLIAAIGIIFVIIGLILASLKFEEIKSKKLTSVLSDPGVIFALFTMIAWGVYWTLIRFPVEKIGWYYSAIPNYFFFVILFFFHEVKGKMSTVAKDKKILLICIVMSMFTVMANFSYNLGITYGYTSIVAPVAGASPILFVILARFIFKDRLNHQQLVGIISALAGIVLIGSGV